MGQLSSFKGPAIALLAFFAYSTHDALIKALPGYSVFQILFFAMMFSCVPFCLARVSDPNPPTIKANNYRLVFLRTICTSFALVMAFLTFSTLPMVEAYVMIFLTPVVVTINSIIFLNERVFLFRWTAMAVSLIGVIIVLRPTIDTIGVGHLTGLLAAVSSGCGATLSRKIGPNESSATMILFQLLGGILLSGLVFPFFYKPMPLADLGLTFLLGTFGLIGHVCLVFAYKISKAATIAPIQYIQIVFAAVYGSLFFGENIDAYVILGASLIVGAGIFILWRESKYSDTQPNLKTRVMRGGITAAFPMRYFREKK